MNTRAFFLGIAMTVTASAARATPSTQIWIPSTDVQKFATVHLNYDVYARPEKATLLVLGPTVGVLPFEKVQLEVGFDLMLQSNPDLDKRPVYGHAKLAAPEDAAFTWSPAVAVGIYNVGTSAKYTRQDIAYGLLARTLPYLGRLSVGYFYADPDLLVDENGDRANRGLLVSWDRTLTEVSDKLWVAVDYQGGRSMLGALSGGLAWAFAPNVSVIVGYDHYSNHKVAGKDTFTVQLDINVGAAESPPTPVAAGDPEPPSP